MNSRNSRYPSERKNLLLPFFFLSSRISSIWSCTSRDAIAQESEREREEGVKEFIYFLHWVMYISIKEVNAAHCQCSMLFVVFCMKMRGRSRSDFIRIVSDELKLYN